MSLIKLAAKNMEEAAKNLEYHVPKGIPKAMIKPKSFLNRHKGKFILGGLAGLGIGAYMEGHKKNESY